MLVTAAVFPVAPSTTSAAGAQDAPDGSRSHITQDLVSREALPGGGWRVTIEATLDSNAVCHVLLFQCVVQPELAPQNMTLERVDCLSARWNRIQITLPVVGTVVDVCARFDANRAGQDQKFRFTYTTPLDTGSVDETVRFYRFPEEYFFVRAQDTITIDLTASADILEECPDTVAAGAQIVCSVTVDAHTGVPSATVSISPPAQFGGASLVPDDNSGGNWDCTAVTACTYTPGPLPAGQYGFTTEATVSGPVGEVETCAAIESSGSPVGSDCDQVRVYDADVDTSVAVSKTASATEVDPGASLSFTIVVTNEGPNEAQDVRMDETPSEYLEGSSVRFTSGAGEWTCSSGATLACSSPTLPSGGSATFEVTGTVSPSAPGGSVILNEVTVEYENDPFGPDYPVRDGAIVQVRGATAPAATPVSATPNFTG